MNSAPVTLPLHVLDHRDRRICRRRRDQRQQAETNSNRTFHVETPSESAGSLVAPAPVWFHGWIKNSRLVRQRNRPIAPDGRQGQPPDASTAFSRDAVGIVIFGKVSACCAPRPHCRTVAAESARRRLDRGRTGSKRYGFSFHGDAPHAPCRHPSDRVLGERRACRGGELAGLAAATCGHAVTVAIGPEGWSRAGRPPRRRRRPNNIACRRIPPPSRRWRCPAARSTSPPPRARSGCSTTRASRRPISPTPPTSSTASIAQAGR